MEVENAVAKLLVLIHPLAMVKKSRLDLSVDLVSMLNSLNYSVCTLSPMAGSNYLEDDNE